MLCLTRHKFGRYNQSHKCESAQAGRKGVFIGDSRLFTRTTGFVIVPLWLAAMTWLIIHDVWPGLIADDPPRLQLTDWLRDEGRETQYAIRDRTGDQIGTVWTTYLVDELSTRREDLVWLEELPVAVTPLRINIASTYSADGVLDEFTMRIENRNAHFELHGERFHADFSFELKGWIAGRSIDKTFKTPLMDGGVFSSGLTSFTQLTGLYPGRTWRVQVINPLAALTGVGNRFQPMIVRVTGEEHFTGPDGVYKCMVVEAPNAKAWVDEQGVVRAQEFALPLLERIQIIRESGFDAVTRQEVAQEVLYSRRGVPTR
jgi:hypothetical protein